MIEGEALTERENDVLRAVIRTYVETAEPAGSRAVVRRFPLGISAATVRNTMGDLEEKGYLYHPHTSAGRVPTQRAYRIFVDALMGQPQLTAAEADSLRDELAGGERSAVEEVVRRATQVLGLLTRELGIAIAPRLDRAILERLDLVAIAERELLLVLSLRAAGPRTIFVNVPTALPEEAVQAVAAMLNERLAGLSLQEIRTTLPARVRDSLPPGVAGATELLNVFIQSADEWFRVPAAGSDLHLGRASVLALQPEFTSGERFKELIELTERRDLLEAVLGDRLGAEGLRVTIGDEHAAPQLSDFTVVTSEYRAGALGGVIGVIGPTRMPYERVIAFVESTSELMSDYLQ